MIKLQNIFVEALRDAPLLIAGGGKLPMEEIRRGLRAALHDCKDIRAQRVIYNINIAKTPVDLWRLRGDLMQRIAQVHNQRVAAERFRRLIPIFEGWLPESQLLHI